jgi:predicted ABC-type transport system involved in lysophospholipase L1 biosynthesis ATPase subunit
MRAQCDKPTGNLKKETKKKVFKNLIVLIIKFLPALVLIPQPGKEIS